MLFRSNDTATTEIYTLSLHDALPISGGEEDALQRRPGENDGDLDEDPDHHGQAGGRVQAPRQTEPVVLSEERGGLDASDDNAEEDSGPEI